MLEIVRCKLMRRIQGRRDKMKNWTNAICPKIFKKVEINKAKAGGCATLWSGGGKFQVRSGGISQYIVDLDLRTCSRREWDLIGWPCVHGVAAINYNGGLNVGSYRFATSNARLTCESIPKFDFGRALCFLHAFVRPIEWAELWLLLLERDRSGYSRWSDQLGIALRELFCLNRALPEFSGVFTFVKIQTLLVLAFAKPNL
ncbi:hypothetical protein L3X38_032398 [Prunus dulcis]|uniref:SWIM-type domain-containing protein n=1 Tax=Prunus dulcis TaxID=3755 RepID=A0AAD4VG53_PRUDU|nr:hypothetical protein L3X38_032398 [Prunus dulcis]